jgi:pimeloyl-ACP methyl ester carboxylesterase
MSNSETSGHTTPPWSDGDLRQLNSADGTPLALWDFGGNGPNLLFVHATGFCAQVWAPMAGHLRDRYRCLSLDVRGHGRSDPRPEDLSWDRVAEDVDAAIGVGHSMGGAGLLLAATTPRSAASERLRAMWLFEPIVFPPEFRSEQVADNRLAAGARKRRATFPNRQGAFDNFASKPPLNTLSADALWAYVDAGFESSPDGITLRCRPEVEAAFYEGGACHEGWERAPLVSIPTAVAVGVEAPMSPAALAPAIAARVPGCDLVELRQLGHFGPLEDPPVCAEAVAQFAEPL